MLTIITYPSPQHHHFYKIDLLLRIFSKTQLIIRVISFSIIIYEIEAVKMGHQALPNFQILPIQRVSILQSFAHLK